LALPTLTALQGSESLQAHDGTSSRMPNQHLLVELA
jgi:hypothetical protein